MFSWLFGGSGDANNNNNNENDKNVTGTTTPNVTGSDAVRKDDIAAVGSVAGTADIDLTQTDGRLDPSVFERIAKAAEAIKSSEHASELLTLAKSQEETWQQRFSAMKAEAEAKSLEEKTRQAQVFEEERRRSMAMETEQQQKRAQYQDQLARKRYNDQLYQQEQLNDTERKRQEASVARQEQERRRTLEYQSQLQRETELMKAKADGEARIRQERENRDIRDEQLVLQAQEFRTTVLEGIKQAGETMGEGVRAYLSDTPRMLATVGVIGGIALGIYAAKSSTTIATQAVLRRMATPPLVRETSRSVKFLPKLFRPAAKPDEVMRDIIFPSLVEQRLQSITIATANTRRNRANYRNVLLHGPPGTGKTMFGRRLAQQTGLDYAILAGGDVGPLGKDAVTEIHKVFDWAQRSNKGLVLFIDEAEAFLRQRSSGSARMSEDMRNALSTFLYRTGDPSNKFMIVLSSNEPQELDRAVLDRVDESVHVDLPELPERVRLLNLYYKKHIVEPTTSAPVLLSDDMQDVDLSAVAKALEGFSGRQIAKLCVAWQATANATVNNMLTKELFNQVLNEHMTQHKEATAWINKQH
ncbi:hypothetical protein PTSG_12512 [Salpingoeca rosetta]|uniref:AAA+ ATPase domain-containing protein n=1 Tax=Salpingoeca rosetta (strain ATCC 50818 / BSB-021) TaxID=946362 RepID=F2UF86_SALR5|nr:uncharacterized protein PTSG_12512 [Salpingoeca rosetta]EGD75286.1 hypothetical protein PTSG_12512 [Salpingoeca rosetta]|eukprot:XP_004992339.1 hypothetical protein PTSG_12512 [Salpingoeca rosetta]